MGEGNLFSLQMECTMFFQENPYAFETIDGLALRVGRKVEQLEPILQELVSLSILKKIGEGENSIYCYVKPDIINEEMTL